MQNPSIKIWQFIRSEIPVVDFEQVLYANQDGIYEKHLGSDLYMKCIENPYGDRNLTYLLKEELKEFQRKNYSTECKCIEMGLPLHVVAMGFDDDGSLATYILLRHHWEPKWWLSLKQCNVCARYKLVAQEERMNDVWIAMELDNQQTDKIILNDIWPTELDEYTFLLETGRTLQQFSFDDPYNSTLSDLVHEVRIERPGISMDYLAELVNVDLEALSEIITRKSA